MKTLIPKITVPYFNSSTSTFFPKLADPLPALTAATLAADQLPGPASSALPFSLPLHPSSSSPFLAATSPCLLCCQSLAAADRHQPYRQPAGLASPSSPASLSPLFPFPSSIQLALLPAHLATGSSRSLLLLATSQTSSSYPLLG